MNRHERRARAAKVRQKAQGPKKGDVWWKQHPTPGASDEFTVVFRMPNVGMPEYTYEGIGAVDRAKRWSLAFTDGARLAVERTVEEYRRGEAMQLGDGEAPFFWSQRVDPGNPAYVIITMRVPAGGLAEYEWKDTEATARMVLWAVAFLSVSGVDIARELREYRSDKDKAYGEEPS